MIRFTNEEVIDNVLQVVSKINYCISISKVSKNRKRSRKEEQSKAYNIEVFTTRPDTIFGVSFMTLAPEHELVSKIVTDRTKSNS